MARIIIVESFLITLIQDRILTPDTVINIIDTETHEMIADGKIISLAISNPEILNMRAINVKISFDYDGIIIYV